MGVEFDPDEPTGFTEDYVVQKRYFGTEITTAFYVDRSGLLLGHVSMARELRNGITFMCTVTTTWDDAVGSVLERLTGALTFRGPCNLQSIVTEAGEVMPFEINARISGSASIRAHFGFDDIAYLLDEYVYGRRPRTPRLTAGSAVRMLTDVIYPGAARGEIESGRVTTPFRF